MDIERESDQIHGGPGAFAASTSSSSSTLGQTSFYSLPPSPTPTTLSLLSSTFGSETDQISASATSNHDAHWDDFQTSGRIHLNESDDEITQCHSMSPHRQKKEQVMHQNMLFTDIATCNHLTLSPPLKLPPRLQHEYHFDSSNPRSSVSSSQSPVSLQKVRISRHTFKSDDFDPFLVAMKKVTAEGRRVMAESKFHDIRRASSFSSVWARSPNESRSQPKHVGPSISMGSIEISEQDHDHFKKPIFRDPKEISKDVAAGISASKRLGEPKGLKKARAIRLVKMGCCEQSEPIIASTNGPRRESGASVRMKKPKDESKPKSPKAPLWKVTFLRVFRFKKVQPGKDKRDKSAYKLVRLTVVLYRPRLSFCLGMPRDAS